MKKILATLLVVAALLFAVPAVAKDCEYSGFIKGIESYAWFGGTYSKEYNGYIFIAQSESYIVGILWDKEHNTTQILIIDLTSLMVMHGAIDKTEGKSVITYGMITMFGILPIAQGTIDLCETEAWLSYSWNAIVDADFYTNIRSKDTNSY